VPFYATARWSPSGVNSQAAPIPPDAPLYHVVGRVIDDVTGLPVLGATVSLESLCGMPGTTGRSDADRLHLQVATDQDGKFAFDKVPTMAVRLSASRDDYLEVSCFRRTADDPIGNYFIGPETSPIIPAATILSHSFGLILTTLLPEMQREKQWGTSQRVLLRSQAKGATHFWNSRKVNGRRLGVNNLREGSLSCLRSYQKGNARGPDGGPSTGIGRFLRHSNVFLRLHYNSRMAVTWQQFCVGTSSPSPRGP